MLSEDLLFRTAKYDKLANFKPNGEPISIHQVRDVMACSTHCQDVACMTFTLKQGDNGFKDCYIYQYHISEYGTTKGSGYLLYTLIIPVELEDPE